MSEQPSPELNIIQGQDIIDIENYIGGNFMPPQNGSYLDVINPAIGEAFARVPDSDKLF